MTAHTVRWFEVLRLIKVAREAVVSHRLIAVWYVTRYAVHVSRLFVEPFRGDWVAGCAFTVLLSIVGVVVAHARSVLVGVGGERDTHGILDFMTVQAVARALSEGY